jgi:hypothetical protein
MSNAGQRKPMRRTIRGGRPFFFSDPAIDKVLNMTVTLASEVWALRERLSALEGVQIRQGSLSVTDIDDYEFTPEQEQRLGEQRREFIENLFRILQESVEAAAGKSGAAAGGGERPVFGARISRIARSGGAAPQTKAKAKAKPEAKPKPKARRSRAAAARPAARNATRRKAKARRR